MGEAGSFRFLHVSDTHLGYKQYGHATRMVDFHRSLKEALQDGVRQKVDAVLISGDFFDERNVPPEAFEHAVDGLGVAKDAGVEVLMILGNHDAPWRTDSYSWPYVLQDLGFCKILAPTYDADGSYRFEPYDAATKRGGYVDHNHVRVYGIPYQGYRLKTDFPFILQGIEADQNRFTILMAHFGVHGEIRQATDGIPYEAFTDLGKKVDYLALGHYHKRYELPAKDPWVFNPGGTENRDAKEVGVEKGYYIVDVKPDRTFTYKHHQCWERPYHRWEVDVEGARNASDAEARIHHQLEGLAKKAEKDAIIEVKLTGRTEGGEIRLDCRQLEADLVKLTGCLFPRVMDETTRAEADIHINAGERFDPRDIEHDVIRQALQGRFPGVEDAAAKEAAKLVVEVKDGLNADEDPDHLLAKVRRIIKRLPKPEATT